MIEVKCKAYPHLSAQKLYEELRDQRLLGDPPVHYNTLLRIVKTQGWLAVKKRTDARKAYELDNVNDLWICDFLHGPQVQFHNRSHKAILCAIIDDHSRMIVGHAFSASETISALTVVLKEAFLTYGIPKGTPISPQHQIQPIFCLDNGQTYTITFCRAREPRAASL